MRIDYLLVFGKMCLNILGVIYEIFGKKIEIDGFFVWIIIVVFVSI